MAAPKPYEEVVAAAVRASDRPVIAEARDLEQALAAVRGGAAVVLLDNFAPGIALREVVAAVRGVARELGRRVEIEASGGIRLDNARAFADCGVDRLSVGELTHSPRALDLSLLMDPAR
jgi:nicotinate-nucleotide pyrophosphorylase (carboxylating)